MLRLKRRRKKSHLSRLIHETRVLGPSSVSSIQNVQCSTENLVEIGHFSDVNESRPVLDANVSTNIDSHVLPSNV